VRNGDQTTVRLVLKDVNDNAPQMPSKPVPYEIDENANEVKNVSEFPSLSNRNNLGYDR
jgi:hypothetical protein